MTWDEVILQDASLVDENADICAAHKEVKLEIAKADADALAELVNKQLVEWRVDKNFPGVTEYPVFTINPAM